MVRLLQGLGHLQGIIVISWPTNLHTDDFYRRYATTTTTTTTTTVCAISLKENDKS